MSREPTRRCEFDAGSTEVLLEHRFPADVTRIGSVVERVMEAVRASGCGQVGDEFGIELSVTEALANAVRHGAGEDARQEIEVCVACDPGHGLLIVVRDPGPGFDPAKIPSPIHAANLYRSHGRGIYLINRFMDDVRWQRDGSGTELWMRKGPPAEP